MTERPRKSLKAGDVFPAHVLRDEYGMDAENRPYFKVHVDDVPESLRILIPYVERWAIPCDVTRGDYFDKQSERDITDFYDTVLPFTEKIEAWLQQQSTDVRDWPAAAIHFLYFLKAHSEAYQPTEEEIAATIAAQRAARERKRAMNSAISEASEAFRENDYARVVSLLSPFKGELRKTQATELDLAIARQKQ